MADSTLSTVLYIDTDFGYLVDSPVEPPLPIALVVSGYYETDYQFRMTKKVIIFIGLTIVLLFSIFELYNLSALYRDQNEVNELLARNLSQLDVHQQKASLVQLNLLRTVFLAFIVFYIAFYVRKLYKLLTRKIDLTANNIR